MMRTNNSYPDGDLPSIETTCPYCNETDWNCMIGPVPMNGSIVGKCYSCGKLFVMLITTVVTVGVLKIEGQE